AHRIAGAATPRAGHGLHGPLAHAPRQGRRLGTPMSPSAPPAGAMAAPATTASLAGAAYRLLVTTAADHVERVSALAADVARFAALGDDSQLPQAIEVLQAGTQGMQLDQAPARAGWLTRASGRDRDLRDALAS